MHKPIVVNLFGAPSAGKSTAAAYIFAQLKMHGINCELVTEFAKDKTWEHNTGALSNQAYVFGKQSYRMSRCAEQVDVIITDSPLLLSVIYNNDPVLGEEFNQTVFNVFNSYRNRNYLLTRAKPYNPIGRNQSEEESDSIGRAIDTMLTDRMVPFQRLCGDIESYNKIILDILNKTNSRKEDAYEE